MTPGGTLAPGYVLHRRRYRETSLLIEAFTREEGRIGLIARGAASGKSSRAALLQSFQEIDIGWRGRGELPTVTQVEPRAKPLFLTGNALASGFYLNELVLRLTARNDPSPVLFECYRATLGELASDNLFGPLRRFELTLLEEIGYGLDLSSVEPNASHLLFFPGEPTRAVEAGNRSQYAVAAATVTALATGVYGSTEIKNQARNLLSAIIDHHLGGYRLRSRELLRPSSQELTSPPRSD